MEYISTKNRNKIMQEGLKELEKEGYISYEVYEQVHQAQNQYYIDLTERNRAEWTKEHNSETIVPEKTEMAETSETKETTKITTPVPKPIKPKKVLSPQEVRERNITWSLNLGVILLLIGGLVLATSTWETLENWMKTGLVALVAVLFFGLAYITNKILNITRTAFAFHVLGSLFLPIVILSAGYFELFGSYFSVFGKGRYLLGAIGSLAILPVYLLLAKKLSSRLFIWFSYITLSLVAGFGIAALYLPVDGFYLGIMVFNAALIIMYRYASKIERFSWLTKDFIMYIQANLILSTLMMLVFYNQELFYSFNLILTAVLYLSMIYVTKQKQYHFVFSAMLVYGAYQLIEHSFLNEIGSIFYALLGIIFLALPKYISNQIPLQKVFQYTSAVISGFAFLYISLEGVLLRANEPSFVLMFAYIIIFINFLYLSNKIENRLFNYLSPVFLMSALYELVLMGQEWLGYTNITLPTFIAAFILYIGIGGYIKLPYLKTIRQGTRDISAIVMLGLILYSLVTFDWWQTGAMLVLFAVVSILVNQFEQRNSILMSAPWIHAISIGFAVLMFIEQWTNLYFSNQPFETINLIGSSIVLLLLSLGWKLFHRNQFTAAAFFTSHLFYTFGLISSLALIVNDFLRAAVILGGVGMGLLLYWKKRWTALPFVISSLTLLAYLSVLFAIQTQWSIRADLYQSTQYTVGAVLLFIIGLLFIKKDQLLASAYWWIGHLYLPFSVFASYFFYGEEAIWSVTLASIIYVVSMFKTENEGNLKTFLYAALTSITVLFHLIFVQMELFDYRHYAFFVSVILMAGTWLITKGEWPRRIAYYFIPFSLVAMGSFVSIDPYDIDTFISTLVIASITLWIMYREKFDGLSFLPLAIVYFSISAYAQSHPLWENFQLVAYTGFVVILTLIGIRMYRFIYEQRGVRIPRMDWYSIVGLLTIITMFAFTGGELWTKLLPGILLSVILFLQRKRIMNVPSKWMVFLAVGLLLQPYYVLLWNVNVPVLLERELFVLPWVALAIYLKKILGPTRRFIANRVQWYVLIMVSLLLIEDGMSSSTVYDAIIVGTLSLASMLGGMFFKIRSFFFVGAGVLLLNVFLQTRPFWGNLPWWVYLLAAGAILIFVASYNEWHKQKTSSGKETLLTKLKKNVINKIKSWE